MRPNFITSFAVFTFALAIWPSSGNAAPQILGLVATATPVPLTCSDGVCKAEISAVCLQEDRAAPTTGTKYQATKNSEFTLVMTNSEGRQKSMPVSEFVEIRSLRIYTSVAVSLPQEIVRNFSGKYFQASLIVGPLASAVPVADPNDNNPLSEQEISAYTGPLRHLAENAIHRDKTNTHATGILNQMINRLPSDESGGTERIASLRKQTMNGKMAKESPGATNVVTGVLDTCREKLRVEMEPHLRSCLSHQHDILNTKTTQDVWKSLRPGS